MIFLKKLIKGSWSLPKIFPAKNKHDLAYIFLLLFIDLCCDFKEVKPIEHKKQKNERNKNEKGGKPYKNNNNKQ
jgi:hypothetical protein